MFAGGVYPCRLLKRRNPPLGADLWIEHKESARFNLTVESLLIRESVSGRLLADFPRAFIKAFRMIGKNIIIVDNVDKFGKAAIKFEANQLGELVKELHHKAYPRIHNQILSALESSTSILGKRKHGSIELPNLSSHLVQENIIAMLYNPGFADFVRQLQSVVNGFCGVLEPYSRVPSEQNAAICSCSSNSSSLETPLSAIPKCAQVTTALSNVDRQEPIFESSVQQIQQTIETLEKPHLIDIPQENPEVQKAVEFDFFEEVYQDVVQ
jgi:hypothetical protein